MNNEQEVLVTVHRKPMSLAEVKYDHEDIDVIRYTQTVQISNAVYDDLTSDLQDLQGRFPAFYEGLVGWTRLKADDGRYIFVDTQGFNYARYVGVDK